MKGVNQMVTIKQHAQAQVAQERLGMEIAMRYWDEPCRANMSGKMMRSMSSAFARSGFAKDLSRDAIEAFIDMTYTLSKQRPYTI